MNHDEDLAESKAKTFELIGRNILLFQEMEHLLKKVLPRATISISSDTDVSSMMTTRLGAVKTCTLGALVNRFIAEVCDAGEPEIPGDSDMAGLTATYRLRFDPPDGRDVMSKRLNDLVEGRNRLVHHLLSQIVPNSPASWRSLHEGLEDQYQQTLAEIETLQHLVEGIEESSALIAHPDIRRELLYGPIREQLMKKLHLAARESLDPEGWTSLKTAIHSDDGISSDALTQLLVNEGSRTVSAYLETLTGFEVRHDKDRKGKTRTFYRVTGMQDAGGPDSAPDPDPATGKT